MSRALRKKSGTSLFLMDPPVPASDFRNALWGALVQKPYTPTNGYSSYERKNPIDLVSSLKPQITTINDYEEIIKNTFNAEAKAKFEHVLHAHWKTERTGDQSRKATQAEFWFMTEPLEQLRKLWKNSQYQKDVLDFIKRKEINPKHGLLFVTAMCTLADMEHKGGTGQSTSGGGGATVPNPQDGSDLVDFSGQIGRNGQRSVEGTFQETVIVTIGYHEVTLSKVKGFRASIKKLFGSPSHIIQNLVSIGQGTLCDLGMKDHMMKGNVPYMSEGGNDGEANGDDSTDDNDSEEEVDFLIFAAPDEPGEEEEEETQNNNVVA